MEGSSAKFAAVEAKRTSDVTVGLGGYTEPARRSKAKTAAKWIAGVLAALALISSIAFYFYWQSMKSTPQYSLALIVDAAQRELGATLRT